MNSIFLKNIQILTFEIEPAFKKVLLRDDDGKPIYKPSKVHTGLFKQLYTKQPIIKLNLKVEGEFSIATNNQLQPNMIVKDVLDGTEYLCIAIHDNSNKAILVNVSQDEMGKVEVSQNGSKEFVIIASAFTEKS